MTRVSGEMTLGRLDRLPWISSYYASCIYQQNITVRLFSLLTYEDGNSAAMKHVKHISCVNKLVEAIHYIIKNKQQCQAIEYDIQFICCSCEISEKEGKNIVRKHRKKHVTDGMEPVAKKRFVEQIQKRYLTMDPTKKKELSRKRRQNHQSLDGTEKKKLLHKRKEKFQSMDPTKKKE